LRKSIYLGTLVVTDRDIMDRDERVWRFLLSENRFFRNKEVKDCLGLQDQQVSISLKRLEHQGLLIRDIQYDGHVPRNVYLGIDSEDPRLKVRIVESHGELWAYLEWEEKDGSARMITIELGEIAGYIKQVGDDLLLEWPEWINILEEKGKVTYSKFEW